MKNNKILTFVSLTIWIIVGCQKEETPQIITLTTNEINNITDSSAVSGGNLIADGNSTITSRGICWAKYSPPTINNSYGIAVNEPGEDIFLCYLTNLSHNTEYFVRAFATTSNKIIYGNIISFTTSDRAIMITTNSNPVFTSTSIYAGGTITSAENTTIQECGVCWNTIPNPTVELPTKISNVSIATTFTNNILGLTPGTLYHIRAFATNSTGTTYYGNDVQVITTTFGSTVMDVDSNIYNTIPIGTQIWMVENLKTTKLNDGTEIALRTGTSWGHIDTPAYCWYNDNEANKAIFGALYNGYAVNSGKLAPKGWHVATETDWHNLVEYLGGDSIAGGKLKAQGTGLWLSPNVGATNETGFSALPGLYRNERSYYDNDIGQFGYWWSSHSRVWYIKYNEKMIYSMGYRPERSGYSVRCVKD